MKHLDNIFSWFSSLSTLVKVVSSVIVFSTWIAAGVTTYNNWIIKKHDSKIVIDLKQVSDKLEILTLKAVDQDNATKAINDNQYIISGQVSSLSTQVSDVSGQVNVIAKKLETQTKAIGGHFEKENMLQDKINFLQELIDDEKKNRSRTQFGILSGQI